MIDRPKRDTDAGPIDLHGYDPRATRRIRRCDLLVDAAASGTVVTEVGAWRSYRRTSRKRLGTPVFPVVRPRRSIGLADRRSARQNRPRRVRLYPCDAEDRRHDHGRVAAQPFSDGRSTDLPLYRRRHRDHPDLADDREGTGGRQDLVVALRRTHPQIHGLLE